MKQNIAVVGTGRVALEIISILEEREFPIEEIYILDEEENLAKRIEFQEKFLSIRDINKFDFSKIEMVFFCAGNILALEYVEKIAQEGVVVIDCSSTFRKDPQVPLIIPEINGDLIEEYRNKNIIASPNCTNVIMLMALYPLMQTWGIKRVIASTYQAVSGAGSKAMDELFEQTRAIFNNTSISDTKDAFTKQIAFNVIPHIGDFNENGDTFEEETMAFETQRILNQEIPISVMCVRVPTFVSHGISLNVELLNKPDIEEVRKYLKKYVSVIDYRKDEGYVTPFEAAGEDNVFVSRIKEDLSKENAINMWVVGDNLRKGAALNMVQIAEVILKQN